MPTREDALARIDFLVSHGLPRDRANWLRVWLAVAMDVGLPPPFVYGTVDPVDGVSLEWDATSDRPAMSVVFESPWPTAYVWAGDALSADDCHDALVPVGEGFTARLIALVNAEGKP